MRGVHMFASDQSIIQELRAQSGDFKLLYKRHIELNNTVNKAGSGALALGDATLNLMKREKLQIKDQIAAMVADYRDKTGP